MAIKDKRVRYKKGKRVDMRGGGRVQLAKGGGKNKNKLSLYFADLTHNYIALANGSFPLAIGLCSLGLESYF